MFRKEESVPGYGKKQVESEPESKSEEAKEMKLRIPGPTWYMVVVLAPIGLAVVAWIVGVVPAIITWNAGPLITASAISYFVGLPAGILFIVGILVFEGGSK